MEVFIAGFAAGLALAIPLGPMAILLIGTTIRHGRSVGSAGALAMATVDFSYAALVFIFGSALVTSLSSWLTPMRFAGSSILILIALKIFVATRRGAKLERPELEQSPESRLKTFAKFFGLTILNPATAFYFLGITPSVAAIASNDSGNLLVAVLEFGLGVFTGSLIWQLSLVFAAQLTAKFTDAKVQHRIQYLGAILIILLAIGLLLT